MDQVSILSIDGGSQMSLALFTMITSIEKVGYEIAVKEFCMPENRKLGKLHIGELYDYVVGT